MIVLDEQLLGRTIEHNISRWYSGKVVFITDLRPNTVIKDEAIPLLLRQQRFPTFVTINDGDFWQRTAISNTFCVVCFTLPDTRAGEVSLILKRLLRHPLFRTKAQRMGCVFRMGITTASYYTSDDATVQPITWRQIVVPPYADSIHMDNFGLCNDFCTGDARHYP